MLIEAIGVYWDGSSRKASTPTNSRSEIRIQQGASLTYRLKVITPDGRPLRFDETMILTLSVKQLPTDFRSLITKTGVPNKLLGDGIVDFSFVTADTLSSQIQPGRFLYDVWLKIGDSQREPVVPPSSFVIGVTIGKTP